MISIDDVITEVTPTLESIESTRLEYLEKRKQCFTMVGIPCLIGGIAVAVIFFPFGLFGAFLAFIIYSIAYGIMAGEKRKQYTNSYKDTVIRKLIVQIDPGLEFDKDRGIEESLFERSDLYASPDRYHSEDLVYGKYGKTEFQMAEIHAEEKRERRNSKGKKKTSYHTIFKGVLLIADFHKDFAGKTFVLADGSWGKRGTSAVQLEDAEFENEFSVFSTDQIEARYILSPAMMRRILEIKRKFDSRVRISFKDSSVWIAVSHSPPYLEPDVKTSATDLNQIRNMMTEVSSFIELIEELDLNTRIWTKR